MNCKSKNLTGIALLSLFGIAVATAAPTMGTPVMGPDGHYYEFVTAADIEWDDAKEAADNLTFNGIVGHLATITSAAEDDFIETERQKTSLKELWVGGFQDPVSTAVSTENWTWINGEGTFPGINGATGFDNDYSNWRSGEPNDAYGAGSEQHLTVGLGDGQTWNDEGGPGVNNIEGYVVEYDSVSETFVEPGENELIFAAANVPGSPNPFTSAFQEVLVGGLVENDCCRVVDLREISGLNRKWWQPWYGRYKKGKFDLGKAVDDHMANPNCFKMPTIGNKKAILRPWQRGIPVPAGVVGTPDPNDGFLYRDHEIGVCFVQADVESLGVVFSAEETANVVGFSVDCTEENVSDRPFAGAVTTSPGDRQVDFPYVTTMTAECDGTRSVKRFSDNVIALNLRHFTQSLPRILYVAGLNLRLQQTIRKIDRQDCVDHPVIDPDFPFLRNLRNQVRGALINILLGQGQQAVDKLDEATRLALLLDTSSLLSPMPGYDPYGSCPGNPKGLLVERLMSHKFATCSEIQQAGPGENAKSNGDGTGNCEIEPDILDALPPLPGITP